MYCDIVLVDRSLDLEKFAKTWGFDKLIFRDDFDKMGIIVSKDFASNRELIEKKKVKILVDPHVNSIRDNLHFRSSGLNHIICKLANKNHIAIGFSLDTLDDPVILGRFKQNIKLCRKYKVMIKFFTFAKNKYGLRSRNDLLGLLRSFGMNGKEANEALSY